MLKLGRFQVLQKNRPLQALPLLLRLGRRRRLSGERRERIRQERHKVFLRASAVVSLLLLVEVVEVLEGGEAGHLEGGAHTVVCCAVNSSQLNLGVESNKVKVSILAFGSSANSAAAAVISGFAFLQCPHHGA